MNMALTLVIDEGELVCVVELRVVVYFAVSGLVDCLVGR
jgi:hypothetical protein